MKTTKKRYEAPKSEIIGIGIQSMLCASAGGGEEATGCGAGTTNMEMQDGYGW